MLPKQPWPVTKTSLADLICPIRRSGEFVCQVNSLNVLSWFVPQTIPEPCLQCDRCIILLKEVTAIIEYLYHGGVYLVCNNVDVNGKCLNNIHIQDPRCSQQNIAQSILLFTYFFFLLTNFQHWTWVSISTPTSLELRNLLYNNLWLSNRNVFGL